ncbi:MAG: hypothetical protein VXY07_18830 [Planctomycetota bacterium]|jgi:hypothetical protein|nr:hypothetical protein [Planctomycetota bacterium]MEC7445094.1 hypothetical protein [Planctomycetota bacterium]MEC7449937.1 hypothetical protein [Planctomycetota bacterium]MEC8432650.1 hypothetical protein [Planctomycetota bacterium]MEC8505979.1 hypothetical protein [Planctomycetota bacterium]
MRSAALFTAAMAMLSFGFTGCHTITVHRGAACATGECSSTAQSDCGCGPLRGGLLGSLGQGQMMAGHAGHRQAAASCRRCGVNLLGGRGAHMLGRAGMGTPYTEEFAGPHGPMTPTVGYPYYTTRAPRDFLDSNPPSIGR